MNNYIKILGSVLVIFTTSSLGFYKSARLKSTRLNTFIIYSSLKELKEKIRLSYGEISTLLPSCFPDSIIKVFNGDIKISNHLEAKDIKHLNEYFSFMGMGDIESEIQRINIYIDIFKERFEEEGKKSKEQCRFYRSLGVLCGLLLVVFLW